MKRWYLAFLVIIPLLVFLVVVASNGSNAGFKKSAELAVLRKVGHQLLLASGDSTSLVLPVREISENEFQLTFEKKWRLKPQQLIDIFRKVYPPSVEYVVEATRPGSTEVLYSFVLSPDSARAITTCNGRLFQESHYTITLKLPHTDSSTAYYLGGMLVLIAGGIWLYKRKTGTPQMPVAKTDASITIGKYHFYAEQQQLALNGNLIPLTGKETLLLTIFAQNPNTVIERSRLLKDVWDDEGVMITRSLDMFISKLRKKLEGDPDIRIVNVHGKGYRLEATQAV